MAIERSRTHGGKVGPARTRTVAVHCCALDRFRGMGRGYLSSPKLVASWGLNSSKMETRLPLDHAIAQKVNGSLVRIWSDVARTQSRSPRRQGRLSRVRARKAAKVVCLASTLHLSTRLEIPSSETAQVCDWKVEMKAHKGIKGGEKMMWNIQSICCAKRKDVVCEGKSRSRA